MNRVKSFEVDHTKIATGMYISRIDDDIITYDIRMVKPNTSGYLENDGIHSFEHVFVTYIRNSKFGDNIIYLGPMGCRTGFYLLTKNLSHEDAIRLVQAGMLYTSNFNGEIPGGSIEECGNYLDHNLNKAKNYAADMFKVLKNWTVEELNYN